MVDEIDDGVQSTESEKSQQPRRTRFLTRAQARDLPPPVHLIGDLIEVGADAAIYGDSQSLKTFFALSMCGALAIGLPAFREFAIPNKGMAFYFAAEGKHNAAKK